MTGIYALAHMAVDLSCAFLMYAFVAGGEHWYIWLLAYNFCAFALQMPIGAWADRLDRNSLVAAGGCGACSAAWSWPWPGCLPWHVSLQEPEMHVSMWEAASMC